MLEYDPFSAESMTDPYPAYRVMRDSEPVFRLAAYHGWALARFDDVWGVLQDRNRFSIVEGPVFVQAAVQSPSDLESIESAEPARSFATWDPPEHTQIRRTMMPAFTPEAMGAFESAMRETIEETLDTLSPQGGFDVVRDFVGPVGLLNIARVLGLPIDDAADLFRRVQITSERVPGRSGFTEAGLVVQGEMFSWISEVVAERRRRAGSGSGHSVLELLLAHEVAGSALSDEAIASQLFTLLAGGAETIPKVFAGGILELAHAPAQLAALRADRALVPLAFEEMMRHQGVLQHVGRTALEDVEINGVRIAAGERLFLLLQSANRDERQFEEADRFDLHREARRNVALGTGRHMCIGMHLARLEGRLLLESFLDRIGEFIVDEVEMVRSPSEFQLGYTSLPIVCPSN